MSIESLLSHVMGRPVRTVLPPPEPHDLLQESEQRAATAMITTRNELGRPVPVAAPELPGTHWLPDPYGPDPVVFGSVPRVAATNP